MRRYKNVAETAMDSIKTMNEKYERDQRPIRIKKGKHTGYKPKGE